MKKGLWTLSFLIFFLIFVPARETFAQEVLPTPTPQINYELPYPGLLPDSPLYFLRVIRDRIVGFLISDPLKKTEFDLLQADKRLNASIYLFNKRKTSLAFSTVSKAENYLEEALVRMGEAKIQGRNINELEEKLRRAFKKHQQELINLSEKTSGDIKQSFKNELQRVTGFEERLNR